MKICEIEALFNKISFTIVGIFPFGLASIAAIIYFSNYNHHKYLIFLILLTFVWILSKLLLLNYHNQIKEYEFILLIVSLTVLIRYIVMVMSNVQLSADFLNAYTIATNFAEGSFREIRSARFPYWGFYKVTLGYLMRLFGTSFRVVESFNLLLAGLSSLGIYLLGKLASGSKKIGAISAIIYTFNPADILYKTLPTGEHIFAMLLTFTLLIFYHVYRKSDQKFFSASMGILTAGILLGLMDLYKPLSTFLMIPMVIFVLLKPLSSGLNHRKRNFIQTYGPHIFLIAILFSSFQITKTLGFNAVKNMSGYEPNRSGFGWTLRIGLDVEKGGRWNREISDYMVSLYDLTDENYPLVNTWLVDEVREILKNNQSKLFVFFIEKFDHTWKSNHDFYYWATNGQNGQNENFIENNRSFIQPLLDGYLILMLGFSCFGALYCAKNNRELVSVTLAIFIIAFTALLLVVEIQQRYRSVLFTAMPIFASFGIFGLNAFLKPGYRQ